MDIPELETAFSLLGIDSDADEEDIATLSLKHPPTRQGEAWVLPKEFLDIQHACEKALTFRHEAKVALAVENALSNMNGHFQPKHQPTKGPGHHHFEAPEDEEILENMCRDDVTEAFENAARKWYQDAYTADFKDSTVHEDHGQVEDELYVKLLDKYKRVDSRLLGVVKSTIEKWKKERYRINTSVNERLDLWDIFNNAMEDKNRILEDFRLGKIFDKTHLHRAFADLKVAKKDWMSSYYRHQRQAIDDDDNSNWHRFGAQDQDAAAENTAKTRRTKKSRNRQTRLSKVWAEEKRARKNGTMTSPCSHNAFWEGVRSRNAKHKPKTCTKCWRTVPRLFACPRCATKACFECVKEIKGMAKGGEAVEGASRSLDHTDDYGGDEDEHDCEDEEME
ncbi:hypothetical protein OQA88_13488 [Cercophora sp. LCS_1]